MGPATATATRTTASWATATRTTASWATTTRTTASWTTATWATAAANFMSISFPILVLACMSKRMVFLLLLPTVMVNFGATRLKDFTTDALCRAGRQTTNFFRQSREV